MIFAATNYISIAYPTGQGVQFYGFEVIGYYAEKFLLYYSDYSWTIRLLYGLILACIFTMIILFMLFAKKIHQSRRIEKELLLSGKT